MRASAAVALTVLSFLFLAICLCLLDTNLRLDRVNGKEPDIGRKGQSGCPVGPVRSFASSTFWLSLTL
jgi:hypothetical protein